MRIEEIEYPADGVCPVCGSDIKHNPAVREKTDNVFYVREYAGWVCPGEDCDEGHIVCVRKYFTVECSFSYTVDNAAAKRLLDSSSFELVTDQTPGVGRGS